MKKSPSILILSGGTISQSWLAAWLAENEISFCIAADRGLETAYRMGLKVDLILGDYDSVDKSILDTYRDGTEVLTYPPEKDYTDTHIALKKAIEEIEKSSSSDTVEIFIAGATGTRMDHTLTNIFILEEALNAEINAYIIDECNKVYLKNCTFTLKRNQQYGSYVSFIPATEHVKLTLKGMKYSLTDYTLTQGNSLCQSNEIVEDEATISVSDGKIIVVESKD